MITNDSELIAELITESREHTEGIETDLLVDGIANVVTHNAERSAGGGEGNTTRAGTTAPSATTPEPSPAGTAPPALLPAPTRRIRPAVTRGARPREFGITAIASSTGGPEALTCLLAGLPADHPHPIVVVQHMPPEFTPILAESLDGKCRLAVRQAVAGTVLEAGHVYIAPGGRHLVLRPEAIGTVAELDDSPPECNVRPSANVLFRSLAGEGWDRQAVLAVVLTGMGCDGCAGLRLLKQRRPCYCLAQDEASCVVYGMPRAVVDAGLADEVLPLGRLAERVATLVGHREVLS